MAKILVVDDELGIRDLLFEILHDEGHTVELAENASQARLARQRSQPDLVLLDIWMPDTDGVSLLKEWSSTGLLTMPVIMMSGHASIDTAVEATRLGARSFLEKPITLQKLLKAVETGLASGSQKKQEGLVLLRGNLKEPRVLTAADAAIPDFSMDQGPRAEATFNLDSDLRTARDAFERAYFEFHLAQEGGMTRLAEKSGLERTHLYRKLKQLGVTIVKTRRSRRAA